MHKTPVLVTDSIGARDYIEDSINGILLEPQSTQDMVEKIKMIWENNTLRMHYEEAGIKYVHEFLSGEAISNDVISVINSILKN